MKIKFLLIALTTSFFMGCASPNRGIDSSTGDEAAPIQPGGGVSSASLPAQQPATVPTAARPTSAQEGANYQYVIGPGDTLYVFVWGYKDLSVTIPVRPDGKITTRLVEDMVASGKTPTQLARELEDKYEVYVKNPTVTVTVNKFIGVPSQQVKVVGGGAKPRTVPYVNGMTVLDVMIEVGGLKKFSSGNKAVLVREVNGARKSYRVRLHDLLKKGDIKANGYVQPGDIIIIPESWF
jgi:polysaccharide export outer membrane protein